jgi:hypothetical protein
MSTVRHVLTRFAFILNRCFLSTEVLNLGHSVPRFGLITFSFRGQSPLTPTGGRTAGVPGPPLTFPPFPQISNLMPVDLCGRAALSSKPVSWRLSFIITQIVAVSINE